ncbi:IS3 family transposase [Kitasatospora indigofera]|uniref:IS3 family transposase n=1 Tax=Kitasatospora indigofera TaxID=67307 RepID=UPI003697B1A6
MKPICQVLGITRSTFYYWQASAATRADRLIADTRTTARIRAVHVAPDGTYGVPRVTAERRESSEAINHTKVARLMRNAAIWAPSARARTTPPRKPGTRP